MIVNNDVKQITAAAASHSPLQLRAVDLNLLTVFDAVMQERNITRAARMLKMSQPAVSNAVSRLKVVFDDELFVRYGRGIMPTPRAVQLFSAVRQALQLVQNELPGADFDPASSDRVFNLCICSPLDNRLTSPIFNYVNRIAPNITMIFKSCLNKTTEHQLRYQSLDFIIGYEEFPSPDFSSIPLFRDEMVLVHSAGHPRLKGPLRESDVFREAHAVVSLERYASFSLPWYDTPEKQAAIAYQGMALTSALNIVSQTELVAIAPRWLAESCASNLHIKILPLPMKLNSRTCYLSWYAPAGHNKGHQWMKEVVHSVCGR
ncbi:transcriptional regulator LeuO [Pluralibacter gergoviae]